MKKKPLSPFRILNGFKCAGCRLAYGTLLVVFTCGLWGSADIPETKITNGLVDASLYLPDPVSGYYRGTRFDWSGVIPRLTFKGHNYFGQWFDKYDPKLHDAIMGPVEEFTALGFEDAAPGEEFLKIGVGSLIKPDDPNYSFAKSYEIKNPGTWRVKKSKSQVEFIHELKDASGYAYIYKKTVSLLKGKPTLVLDHSLKNTGRKGIQTTVYNHNFFTIDQEPTGPDIKILFPYDVVADGRGFGTIANTGHKAISYSRLMEKGENVYSAGLKGYGNAPDDHDVSIENLRTKAGVRITCDQAIDKFVFWACSTTSCPEPYVKIVAAPGKEMKWQIQYEFYTF
jgi:hypothetical protein